MRGEVAPTWARSTQASKMLERKDTFFCVPRGRLKLPASNVAPTEPIYYERANESGPTRSVYFAVQVDGPRL